MNIFLMTEMTQNVKCLSPIILKSPKHCWYDFEALESIFHFGKGNFLSSHQQLPDNQQNPVMSFTRGSKILETLGYAQFYRVSKFPRFLRTKYAGEKVVISKPCKNHRNLLKKPWRTQLSAVASKMTNPSPCIYNTRYLLIYF